jgi:hypothetical protein
LFDDATDEMVYLDRDKREQPFWETMFMSKKDGLSAFLRSKAGETPYAEPGIDWEARKNTWLGDIAKLYAQVKEWLAPLERDGTVRYSSRTTTLREEYLDSYEVDVLTLLVGNQRVEFRPKGTLIVGANGRVDVQGQRALRTIILQKDQWYVVERSPRLKTVLFSEDAFQNILQEVMA